MTGEINSILYRYAIFLIAKTIQDVYVQCLTLYCNLHLQIHLANCNNTGRLSENSNSIDSNQIVNEALFDPRSICGI